MDKGICLLGVIPVRKSPESMSELVTQLLWGETFKILDQTKKWYFIKSCFDNYEGWVYENQVSLLNDKQIDWLSSAESTVTESIFGSVTELSTGKVFIVPAGSELFNFNDGDFLLGRQTYKYEGSVVYNSNQKNPSDYARLFLNAPHMWGGRTIMGIDCSGLTQIACKMAGIKISRDSYLQADEGKLVHFHHETKPGDIMFFDDREGIINHVGIALDNGLIIHACGKVRIDSVDQQGIYNAEKKKYTHQLRFIKRMMS